ncbi:MAG: hypothetical protein ACT4QD_25525 [Acidobacteriota bacterium]
MFRRHVASRARCAGQVAMAHRIESVLRARSVAEAPPAFTRAVMARVREDRYRVERIVDAGFNAVVAAGLLVVFSGLLGLAWRAGLVTFDDSVRVTLVDVTRRAVVLTVSQMPTAALVALLMSIGIGLWWWTESDVHA